MRIYTCKILILILSLLGCRARTSTSSVQADSVVQSNPSLFFGGNQAIQICVQMSDAVKTRLSKSTQFPVSTLKKTVFETYAYWVFYMLQKGVQKSFSYEQALAKVPIGTFPLNTKPSDVRSVKVEERLEFPWPDTSNVSAADIQKAFPVAIAWVDNCRDADLEVHFGTKPTFANSEVTGEADLVLGAIYTDKNPHPRHSGWHRGAIVLQDQSESIDYKDTVDAEFILMHEWGHVLGVPHVVGTVMDPNILTTFAMDSKNSREFDSFLRPLLFNRNIDVDRWRQLVICQQLSCSSAGLTMGLLGATADINEKTGLDRFQFGYLGDLSSANPTPTVSRNFGKIETENSTNIAEVFRRPMEVHADPVFHKTIVINRWLNKSYLTKAMFNGNAPNTPPISVQGDCRGKKIKIFESGFTYGYQPVLPWYLNQVKQLTPLIKTKEFADCVQDTTIFPEQTYLQINENQKQRLSKMVYKLETQQSELYGLPRTPWQNLPQKNTYCTYQVNGVELCLYHKGNLAVMRIGSPKNTELLLLAPILPEGIQDEPRFKYAWGSKMDTKLPGFDNTNFPVRIAISDDIGNAPQIQYEFAVNLLAGIWYPLMSGTLTPATKP